MSAPESMPHAVAQIRREVCGRCDQPCAAYQSSSIDFADPQAQCPRRWPSRWGCYGPCGGAVLRPRGLGDLVEAIAKPIAKALKLSCIDAAGALKPQSPCAQRRDALNRIVPKV